MKAAARTTRRLPSAAQVVGACTLFTGMCAVMMLPFVAAEGWREHARESWPQSTASLGQCSVDLRYYNGPDDDDPTWWLECQVSFRVGVDQTKTVIHSGYPSNRSRAYPGLMYEWVDQHPSGSPIVVRYDPMHVETAMPATDYMPNGAPRASHELRILVGLIVACAGLGLGTKRLRDRARATRFSD